MLSKRAVAVAATLIVAAVCLALLFSPSSGPPSKRTFVQQKGSETMYDLGLKWAEDYTKKNPLMTINVTRGGSGPGISALLDGTIDIAQSSRPMTAAERSSFAALGRTVIELKVAVDGIAILVNPDNPVDRLSIGQLKGIFNGTIVNWREVGGADLPILLFGRNATSGTYAFFQEHVLGNGDYSPSMIEYDNYDLMIPDIMSHPGSVGYVGIGFANNYPDVKILALQADDDSQAFLPDEQHVLSGEYPLWRFLYFYLDRQPQGPVLDYLRWIVDPDGGQLDTKRMGFYAISQATVMENLSILGE